jgi:hypothetical protein
MWTQTYTGKRFDPLNPDPALICIEDISWALSNICRFGGHSSRFYSVAQHSFHLAYYANTVLKDRSLALACLLHDASEAYLGDVPRPIKYRPEFAFYREAEAKLEAMIFHKFGVNEYVGHPEVKHLDNAILADEARELMGDPGSEWGLTESGLKIALSEDWRPGVWNDNFQYMFRALTA